MKTKILNIIHKLNFNFKLFIGLMFGFIGFTVIGTLTHECGHAAVAEYLGYHTRIG